MVLRLGGTYRKVKKACPFTDIDREMCKAFELLILATVVGMKYAHTNTHTQTHTHTHTHHTK